MEKKLTILCLTAIVLGLTGTARANLLTYAEVPGFIDQKDSADYPYPMLLSQAEKDNENSSESSRAAAKQNGNEISVFASHDVREDAPGNDCPDNDCPSDGKASATVDLTRSYVISSKSHLFDFTVTGIGLELFGYGHGGGYAESGYSMEIMVNGTTAWSSSATLYSFYNDGWALQTGMLDTSGYKFDISSEEYADDSPSTVTNVVFAGKDFSVDLSQYVSNGQTATVYYNMSAWATDLPFGTHPAPLSGDYMVLGSGAGIGDPFGINGSGIIIDDSGLTQYSSSNPVPEPSTILLFFTGLASLVGCRRKREGNV